MMPAAMENRNEVFITDQGSSRDSRSRALRVRRATPAFGLAAARTSGLTPVDPAPDTPGTAPTAGSSPTPAAPGAPGAPGVTSGGWTVGTIGGTAVRYSGGALPPPPVVAGPPVAI
jgi:hypothetical protein